MAKKNTEIEPYHERSLTIPTTTLVQDLGKELGKKTPDKVKHTRPGPGGMKLTYAPWAWVAGRLNDVFGPAWSIEHTVEPKMQNGEVIVGIRLTTPLGRQDAYGGHKYMERNPNASYADALQSAQSKALRRAAARWGIGLDLYWSDEEVRDEDADVVAARVALKSAVKMKGYTDEVALSLLSDYFDREFKSYGEVVLHILNQHDNEIAEPAAIWGAIRALMENA